MTRTTPLQAAEIMAPLVTLVDDDPSVRAALADLLASVGLATRSFASIPEWLAARDANADTTADTTPGCLVLDVRMPGQSGLDFQRRMHEHGLFLPVIFITGHGDIAMGVQAMKNGAIEFLTKPFRDQDLLDAIYRGIEQDRVRVQQAAARAARAARWQSLTDGERAVAQGVIEGLLNKQIAHRLNLSEVTIKVRRARAMHKLQVRTVADLVRLGERLANDA